MAAQEEVVYDALAALGIPYERFEHPPVFTVEEAERYWADIPATHCKNLFLRNAKGTRHYLVVLEHSKKADLKLLAAKIGDDRLSFASADRLMRFLGLTPGSVSPMGLLHARRRRRGRRSRRRPGVGRTSWVPSERQYGYDYRRGRGLPPVPGQPRQRREADRDL